jgi:hypothetical protein
VLSYISFKELVFSRLQMSFSIRIRVRQTGWHAGCISDAMPRVSVNVRARLIASNLLLGSAVMLLFQLRVIAGQPGPTGSPTGQSVTLGWDPNNDPDVAGYKIYYGTASQTYTNVVVVGNTNNGTITGLVAGTTYYFAATEYNLTGAESAFSDEVSYTLPEPAAQLSAAVCTGGQFSFTVLGTTGQMYVVQASTNLLDWVSVLSNTAPFVFVDSNTAGFNQRFFRALNY